MENRKVLAIDINDVLRDYSGKFISLYSKNIDKSFDKNNMEFKDNNFHSAFDMSKMERDEFMYEEFPLELFGFAKETNFTVAGLFNIWTANLTDYDEYPEVILMSCEEHDKAIPATFFFLSRSGVIVRKMYFPESTREAWDLADVIVTANPKLIKSKPEGKTVIKINTPYNEGVDAEHAYDSLNQLIEIDDRYKEDVKKFKEILDIC